VWWSSSQAHLSEEDRTVPELPAAADTTIPKDSDLTKYLDIDKFVLGGKHNFFWIDNSDNPESNIMVYIVDENPESGVGNKIMARFGYDNDAVERLLEAIHAEVFKNKNEQGQALFCEPAIILDLPPTARHLLPQQLWGANLNAKETRARIDALEKTIIDFFTDPKRKKYYGSLYTPKGRQVNLDVSDYDGQSVMDNKDNIWRNGIKLTTRARNVIGGGHHQADHSQEGS